MYYSFQNLIADVLNIVTSASDYNAKVAFIDFPILIFILYTCLSI